MQDLKIRKLVFEKLKNAGISRVIIERSINKINITTQVSRPGMVIGRSGAGVEELKKHLEKLVGGKVSLNVEEIKKIDLNAYLVASGIADQIVKRMPLKRVMIQAADRAMRSGALGVKIVCSGRLGGAEIARRQKLVKGSIPLQTLRSNIDYAQVDAKTATAGVVGVKVWVNKKETSEKEQT